MPHVAARRMPLCSFRNVCRKFRNSLILPARRKTRCPIRTSRHISPGQWCACACAVSAECHVCCGRAHLCVGRPRDGRQQRSLSPHAL
eukprot:6246548-Prymnesium_polylepis.1